MISAERQQNGKRDSFTIRPHERGGVVKAALKVPDKLGSPSFAQEIRHAHKIPWCYPRAMCDAHEFTFDVDRAFADQLVARLEASPAHPLSAPEAPSKFGVYALYRAPKKTPVYIGQAVAISGVVGRLRDHLRKVENRSGISVSAMTCRYLLMEKKWEISRAEIALIARYDPPWQGIPGFSMHAPGAGRPALPGYANEWDKQFPRLP